jgi:hypothetical protein
MNSAQIRCPGCKKTFSLSGYPQHVGRTQRAICRAAHVPGIRQWPSHFQTDPAVLVAATRGPADHGMNEIGHDADDDGIFVLSQAMNGMVIN